MIKAAQYLFALVCIPQMIGGVLYIIAGNRAQKVVGFSQVFYGLFNAGLFYIVPIIFK